MGLSTAYQYIFLSLICGGATYYFLCNTEKYARQTPAQKAFEFSTACAILLAICDVLYAYRAGEIFKFPVALCYVATILYTLASLLAAYYWFVHSEMQQNAFTIRTKTGMIISSIPMIAMALLVLSTPFTGLVFEFVDGNYYEGILYKVFVVVVLLYFVFSGFAALARSFNSMNFQYAKFYRTLFAYAMVFLIFEGVQWKLGQVMPFRTMSLTIVYFLVQDRVMKSRIATMEKISE